VDRTEAYSREVSSCGFRPGNGGYGRAAFYSYAYPEKTRFGNIRIAPDSAFYDRKLGQFILPYDAVRQVASPDERILQFPHATYGAAAYLG
jgi:hypothetical protein